MRIRLKPMDTHLSPLHASRGHYTRRSGGESVIVTAARYMPDELIVLMIDNSMRIAQQLACTNIILRMRLRPA